jgi:hypothetical protein
MNDPRIEFERYLENMPPAMIGSLIAEYVRENNHNGWDGFNRHNMTGVRALFTDIMLYGKHHSAYGEKESNGEEA